MLDVYLRTRHPFIQCSTSACVNYISHLDLYFLKLHKLYFFLIQTKTGGFFSTTQLWQPDKLPLFPSPQVAQSMLRMKWKSNYRTGVSLTVRMQTPPRQISYILCISDRIPSFFFPVYVPPKPFPPSHSVLLEFSLFTCNSSL